MKEKYLARLAIMAVLGELALISGAAAYEMVKGWLNERNHSK